MNQERNIAKESSLTQNEIIKEARVLTHYFWDSFFNGLSLENAAKKGITLRLEFNQEDAVGCIEFEASISSYSISMRKAVDLSQRRSQHVTIESSDKSGTIFYSDGKENHSNSKTAVERIKTFIQDLKSSLEE